MQHSVPSIAIVALLIIGAQTTLAQQQSAKDLPSVEDTVVTFEVQSVVQTEGESISQIPSAVMQHLNKQEPLVKLNVEVSKKEGLANVRARYAFASMQAYSEWRRSSETREFMHTLQKSSQNDMRFSVTMMKLPVAQYLDRFQRE